MKNIKKRILGSFLFAVLLCLSFELSVFAAESDETINATCYNIEVTSEGIESITNQYGNEITFGTPRISISGYDEGTLTGNPDGVQVIVNSVGWGGMGVTVKASSSWHGYMSLDILGSDGNVPLSGHAVYSNGETVINDLWHYSPSYYLFSFRGIPSGQSVYVQI